ncbi:uncharacterized protein LOC134535971 [Bacillus rossius redtenbacheri]|uniref:uncharacterized protein LOC134535971 n=1 Tax=Bacillus rossius redtenbacheri TaxID=93214 RepID=UPI002FDEF298
MLGCGLWARFKRDRYNSLATVAVAAGMLVFGLIITTIVLHLDFLWLVLVSAVAMLFTAFGYSTCTDKHSLQPASRSESVSTVSDLVAETGSTNDLPPCYDVVVTDGSGVTQDGKPPSYLDALALQRSWPDVPATPHLDASSQFSSSPPPPYREYDMGEYVTDETSDTTLSTSEDASSLRSTSDYATLSLSSYESLCIECDMGGNDPEIVSTHRPEISWSSHDQTVPRLGHFPSTATIC